MAALLTSLGISIHAPREGGDLIHDYSIFALSIISIHAPREGGDSHSSPGRVVHSLFQSTPPARGATRRLGRACRTV